MSAIGRNQTLLSTTMRLSSGRHFVLEFRELLQRLTVIIGLLAISACDENTSQKQQGRSDSVPGWVIALIARHGSDGRFEVEEITYQGRRAFLVTPPDRGEDTGNDHVLHSGDGRIICEFGGIAGQVTAGSCDLDDLNYVKPVFGAPAS